MKIAIKIHVCTHQQQSIQIVRHSHTQYLMIAWLFVCLYAWQTGQMVLSGDIQINLNYNYDIIISFVSVSISVLMFFLRIIVYLHQLTNIRKIAIQSGSLSVSANQSASQHYVLDSRILYENRILNTNYKRTRNMNDTFQILTHSIHVIILQ